MNNAQVLGYITTELNLKGDNDKCHVRFLVSTGSKDYKQTVKCVAFGKVAENIVKHFEKGSLILLQGSLISSNYEIGGKNNISMDFKVERTYFVGNKPILNGIDGAEYIPSNFTGDMPF